jgi:diadenosine tetraphosphatase ApaH/serine/threonine PP2A family protein phosphatase
MRLAIAAREQPTIAGRQPSLPQGTRIYAIGDIHGRLDLLEKLLGRIETDLAERPVARPIHVFLGDYIDRGRWSQETIDRLISHGSAHESVFLRGNHELIAVNCLSDPTRIEQWLRLGGRETLASYGVSSGLFTRRARIVEAQAAFHRALPAAHFRFLASLRNSFACGDYFFAHAGARPHVELSQQSENDLLWIRGEFLSSAHDFGKIIVHGHTPAAAVEIRRNRINIDTGAFATDRLSCLVLEGEELALIDTVAD